MVPVARRNLFAEKGRFAISVSGVGVAVLLIVTVLALYRGWSRTGQIFREMPGQLWVVQQGTSDPFHSVSLLERADLERTASVPGVRAVVPVMSRQMTLSVGDSEESVRLMALDASAGLQVTPELRERFLPDRGTIIIESVLSRQTGLHKGDRAEFGDVSLTVADVRPAGSEVLSQFAFVHFEDAKQIFGIGDIVTYGMVVLLPDAGVPAVAAAIADQNPRLKVYTAEEFAKSIRKEIDESFIPVIAILVAIGFVVGTAVVGLTIYTATIERTREFGVMKAVGASAGFLYRIVLSQSAMLVAAGFLVGLLGARILADLAAEAVPEFATDFQARDIAAVGAAALVTTVIASLVPARRVNSIDPALVFRA